MTESGERCGPVVCVATRLPLSAGARSRLAAAASRIGIVISHGFITKIVNYFAVKSNSGARSLSGANRRPSELLFTANYMVFFTEQALDRDPRSV